jgi:hypothetical protein
MISGQLSYRERIPMKLSLMLMIFLASVSVSMTAWSQDGKSSLSLPEGSSTLKETELKPPSQREDIDQEITNARLRAQHGAKSLWSVKSSLTYVGGSVKEPLSNKRPALSPGTSVESDVKLTGHLALNYRATDHDSLNAGFGFAWLTPGYSGEKGQSEDPYLGYSRAFRTARLQNIVSFEVMKYTAASAVNSGRNANAYLNYTLLSNLGDSRWQLGGVTVYHRDFFTRDEDLPQDCISLIPFTEYALTDKLSFRTSFNVLSYYNTQDAPSTFTYNDALQSLGLGISITRDIYLYPSVQWVWQDIRSDKTNVALQAFVNL